MRYPLPSLAAANARLHALERLIRSVDARLPRATPAGVVELEAERARLCEEFDPLYDAYERLTSMAHLPRCPCGKVAYPDAAAARPHLAAMHVIDRRRGRQPIKVYTCEWVPGVWHVGHAALPVGPSEAETSRSG